MRSKLIPYLLIGTLSFTSSFAYIPSLYARPNWLNKGRLTSVEGCKISDKEKVCQDLVKVYKEENKALEEQNSLLREKLKEEQGKSREYPIHPVLLVLLGFLTGGLILAIIK